MFGASAEDEEYRWKSEDISRRRGVSTEEQGYQ